MLSGFDSPCDVKSRYCEIFSVAPDQFEKSLFWRSIRWYIFPMAVGVAAVHPKHFRLDYQFIESIGSCETMADVRAEVASFHWECGISSFLRRRLGVRVSASRIARLAKRLLKSERLAPKVG